MNASTSAITRKLLAISIRLFLLVLVILPLVVFAQEKEPPPPPPAPPASTPAPGNTTPPSNTPPVQPGGGPTITPAPRSDPSEVGIVPCGYGALPRCDLCHLYTLAKNGIDFLLFGFILPVAVVALLIGGILLLASRGNPQMMESGKRAIANTIIGVVIAFGAWLIIATIVNTLGYNGFTAAWNEPPTCVPAPINQQTGGGTGGGGGGSGGGGSAFWCACKPVDADGNGSLENFGAQVASCTDCAGYCQSVAEANGLPSLDFENCTPMATGSNRFCYVPENAGVESFCATFDTETECLAGGGDGCASLGGTCQSSCLPPPPPPPPPEPGTNSEIIAQLESQGVNFAANSTGDCRDVNGNRVGPETNKNELLAGTRLTTCRNGCKTSGQACYPPSDSRSKNLNPSILPTLEIASRTTNFTINSITTGDHTGNSDHYSGNAVDLLPGTTALRNAVQAACGTSCRAEIHQPPHVHVSW